MAKQDFIPNADNNFLVWHDQFKTGVAAQAATLGLTTADTTAVGNDNTALHTKIAAMNSANAIASQATADKTATRGTVEKNVRNLARRIKTNPAYTVAIGQQLGIKGAQDTTDLSASKPDLSGDDQTGGVVELDFTKSVSDGVNIYGKRDNDADYVFLTCDTSSPYVDNRPLLVAGKPADYTNPLTVKREGVFNFCKTEYRPYDAVVVSILQIARSIAPDAITVTSDGGPEAIKLLF